MIGAPRQLGGERDRVPTRGFLADVIRSHQSRYSGLLQLLALKHAVLHLASVGFGTGRPVMRDLGTDNAWCGCCHDTGGILGGCRYAAKCEALHGLYHRRKQPPGRLTIHSRSPNPTADRLQYSSEDNSLY